jgi:hypothetical protein
MTVANGVVYYASMDANGTLFYLEAATGRLLGSFETGATLGCGPSLARGKVFAGGQAECWVLLTKQHLRVRAWSHKNPEAAQRCARSEIDRTVTCEQLRWL